MDVTKPKKSRLGICEICKVADAKYTCPCCECNTCGLICSKKHKIDTDCDGIRVRTSFVKLNNFGNLNLLSDYRLLDDVACKVDSCHRDKLNKGLLPHFPNRYTKLRQAVLARGCDIVILPNHFERHKKNTSIFDVKAGQIKWKIQLTFLNAKNLTVYDNKVSEDVLLSELLEKFILNSEPTFRTVYTKLETYRQKGIGSLTVLMKAERVPAADKKFYKLDKSLSLKDNFCGKTIVEFPQLFVVINGCFNSRKPTSDTGIHAATSSFLINDTKSYLKNSVQSQEQHSSSQSSTTTSDESETENGDDLMDNDEIKLPSYRDLIKL